MRQKMQQGYDQRTQEVRYRKQVEVLSIEYRNNIVNALEEYVKGPASAHIHNM